MKKVLFASTALIATAGVAAAELSLGGSARFGVVYNDSLATELRVHNRFTLNIDGSVDTDAGVNLFARVRVRGGNTGTTGLGASGVSAPRVGLSVSGFTFATGNINGAYESQSGLYSGSVGLTGLGWGNLVGNAGASSFDWDSFSSAGAGRNGVEGIYSNGAFTGHVSWSNVGGNERIGASASYAFNGWTVGGAVQESDTASEDKWSVHVDGSLGNFGIGLGYGDNNGTSKWRVSGSASVGASTNVTAYVAQEDTAGVDTNFGLGFTHSLGGGTLAGGIAQTAAGTTLADLGVRFSF